jgi:predicted ATPase
MRLRDVQVSGFKGFDDVKINGLRAINIFCGRNNSGKSTLLHAIDVACLALSGDGGWDRFPLKLSIEDLFHGDRPFRIALTYDDGSILVLRPQEKAHHTVFEPRPAENQRLRSIYILPVPEGGLLGRRHISPRDAMNQVKGRSEAGASGIDMLFALKYYADRGRGGLGKADYQEIIGDIRRFFPEIEELTSDRRDDDVATLVYREYGRDLDILYTGAGLKRLLDIFVKAYLAGANVILLDEPEAGLHPSLQRSMLQLLEKLGRERGMQFFLATHSPIFLSESEESVIYRIENRRGVRAVHRIPDESLHTIWGDIGVRPGDLLQNDIIVLVEGQKDVIFFEHIIEHVYQDDFKDVAVGVVQYGGDAAGGIIGGKIGVKNLVPGCGHRLWIRDRDASQGSEPSEGATRFKNALERNDEVCHILKKRQIESYVPEKVHLAAQDGNTDNEESVLRILRGDQSVRFKDAAKKAGCVNVQGKKLRRLLREYLVTKDEVDVEIRDLIEQKLLRWRKEILGLE